VLGMWAGGGVFDVGDGLVGAVMEHGCGDAFGLEQADDRFHQAVVLGVADGADRGGDAFQGEVLGEADRGVLAAGVGRGRSAGRPCVERSVCCLERARTRHASECRRSQLR
jgi:hypothetical protein